MELRPMQYKGFVWPHNPRTYTITYDRQVAVHKVPFGRYAIPQSPLPQPLPSYAAPSSLWAPTTWAPRRSPSA